MVYDYRRKTLGFTFFVTNDARRRGLKNWIYTVNHEEDWQWMLDLGVDGFFTDRPEALLKFNRREYG